MMETKQDIQADGRGLRKPPEPPRVVNVRDMISGRTLTIPRKTYQEIAEFAKRATHEQRIDEIREIVGQIKYLDWEIMVRMDGDRPYLQVKGNGPNPDTGTVDEWTGRKWFLSPHMCRNEVIRTAHKAIEEAVLHEMNEQFTYCGVRIFDPRLNYDKIVDMAEDEDFLDARENGMQGL